MSRGRLNVVRAIAALAWSDGHLDDKEKEQLRRLARRVGLDEAEHEQVETFFKVRPSLDGIDFDDLDDKERQAMYLLAAHYAYLDGLVWSGERQALDELARLLGISPQVRALLEGQVRAKKKG